MSSLRAGPKDASVSRPRAGSSAADRNGLPGATHVDKDETRPGFSIVSLKKRADFLKLRRAPAAGTATFVLAGDARPAPTFFENDTVASDSVLAPVGDENAVRVGFTVSKKVGTAVVRNRVKRRLRAAVRAIAPDVARPRHDYVLIAKPASVEPHFEALVDDLARAFARLHARLDAGSEDGGRRGKGRLRRGRARKPAQAPTDTDREADNTARGAGTATSATDPN